MNYLDEQRIVRGDDFAEIDIMQPRTDSVFKRRARNLPTLLREGFRYNNRIAPGVDDEKRATELAKGMSASA